MWHLDTVCNRVCLFVLMNHLLHLLSSKMGGSFYVIPEGRILLLFLKSVDYF